VSGAGAGGEAVLDLGEAAGSAQRLRANVERALWGKPEVVRCAIEAVIAGGHVLLEDVPGVGKTTLAFALARSLDASFRRIQFTSDLLPGDILGSAIPDFDAGTPTGRFVFQRGPIFANVVLADEINRASPRTQSALLEAMGEGSVSVDGTSHRLPDPFLVIATQNPLEHYGTHPLPESQLDRFLMRLRLGYPAPEHEAAVLRDDPAATAVPKLAPVLTTEDVRALRRGAAAVKLDDAVVAYLLALVAETRAHEAIALGASPRGAVALRRAAQARALCDGRDFCIPEDVRELAVAVLAHRIVLDPHGGPRQGSEEVEWLVREIVGRVPVPL
jgi:MoxR-like ATPase